MGCTNETASGTQPMNFQNKVYHQIPTYYTSKLKEAEQMLPNIPQYENPLYSRLVNNLRKSEEKFEDFNFPFVKMSEQSEVNWVRLGNQPIGKIFNRNSNSFKFEFKNATNLELQNIEKALLFLGDNYDLVKKIFDNVQVSNEGFYILHFCIGGNLQKMTDIIIDDFLPFDKNNNYLLKQVQQSDGIWMMLVQKAWAKILGSYDLLNKMNQSEYISEITGVPVPRLYQKGDFLISSKYQFQPGESKYLKICRDSSVKLTIAIWQTIQSQSIQNFIIQIIEQRLSTTSRDYQLLPISTQLINNKLTLLDSSGNMFELQKGQFIVHIYNSNKSAQTCSIVTHARRPVNANTRFQKQFKDAKNTMVINEYKKLHSTVALMSEQAGTQIRFCWIKHRGVFCFKNKSNEGKKICMSIKKEFLEGVGFEDCESDEKEVFVKERDAGFIIVIRRENKDYGDFYDIEIKSAN